mmetsp:Transcript_34203/g.63414  ORF Transcript_34203/g.63414 Transcript_34203/m.63414 type:complete len:216 (-) Transcript_34203:541-1188(-)
MLGTCQFASAFIILPGFQLVGERSGQQVGLQIGPVFNHIFHLTRMDLSNVRCPRVNVLLQTQEFLHPRQLGSNIAAHILILNDKHVFWFLHLLAHRLHQASLFVIPFQTSAESFRWDRVGFVVPAFGAQRFSVVMHVDASHVALLHVVERIALTEVVRAIENYDLHIVGVDVVHSSSEAFRGLESLHYHPFETHSDGLRVGSEKGIKFLGHGCAC